jgi:hypothetical protein
MQAGKRTPKTVSKLSLGPSGPVVVVNFGHMFSCKVSHENPVYSMLRSRCVNGGMTAKETKMERVDSRMMTAKTNEARENS